MNTRPSVNWNEVIESDERVLFENFTEHVINRNQSDVAKETRGEPRRGFHAKPHAGLVGEFRVLPNLPVEARNGIFREPRVFPAAVRLSNGDFHINPDRNSEPRGIAIKLFGVEGAKLLSGSENSVTQDFLATSHSVTSTVRNARQFMAFVRASRDRSGVKKFLLPIRLAREVGSREALRILMAFRKTVLQSHVTSMATEQYLGTAPIKCGPYAVKFSVRSKSAAPSSTDDTEPDFLRRELANRLRTGDIVFDFMLQFYTDEPHTPIEDSSVFWDPAHTPLLTVAQLRIPKCDPDTEVFQQIERRVEKLAFTPWNTIEEHRPLGSVMRARRFAYQASSAFRKSTADPHSFP